MANTDAYWANMMRMSTTQSVMPSHASLKL